MTTIPYPVLYREIREWFITFVRQYDDNAPLIGKEFRQKKVHTERVCELMKELTRREGLKEEDSWIALICARLHDVSRFEQILHFQTYLDHKSFDHGIRAVEVLKEHKVLVKLPSDVQEIIYTAIAWHNKKDSDLPSDLSARENLFLGLLRDADKLDNFRIEIEILAPEYDFKGLSDDDLFVNENVLKDFFAKKCIDYKDCISDIDRIFFISSWIFDLNTKSAYLMCKEKDFFNKIVDFLPENTPRSADMRALLDDYLAKKLR